MNPKQLREAIHESKERQHRKKYKPKDLSRYAVPVKTLTEAARKIAVTAEQAAKAVRSFTDEIRYYKR